MTRILLAIALAVGYIAVRGGGLPSLPVPAPTPAGVPFPDVALAAKGMAASDRASLSQAYGILSRSIKANTVEDPVFPDTAAVRRAHRAAILYVWRAVLKREPGEVSGLREALEGAVAQRIGTEDVPLNPALQADAVAAFADIEASLR